MSEGDSSDVETKSRYPGAPPFDDSTIDRLLFRGRRDDARKALHSILGDDLFVLYAPSGIGKTSLLKASVLDQLRAREMWPVLVRLDARSQRAVSLVRSALRQEERWTGVEVLGLDEPAATLPELMANVEIWERDILQLPVLVFDQFEELFTLWSASQRSAFIEEFAGCIRPGAVRRSSSPPTSTTRRLQKIVVVIREDFLGHLEVFSADVPMILANRQRLEPLTREQARRAIEGPAELTDDEVRAGFADDVKRPWSKDSGPVELRSPPFRYEPDALGLMIDFLCSKDEGGETRLTDHVEPFQLQIVCQHVEREIVPSRAAADGEIVVTESNLGGHEGLSAILRDYYRRQIEALDPDDRDDARRLCERGLISKSERRLSLEVGEIESSFGVGPELLQELVELRLIRSDQRVGSTYYELAHDTLVAPVLVDRRERAAERTRRRRAAAALVAAGVIVVLVGLQVWNVVQSSDSAEPEAVAATTLPRPPVPDPDPVVPGVLGMTEEEARVTLEQAGILVEVNRRVSTEPVGDVISQTPPGGDSAAAVEITVSAGENIVANDFDVQIVPGRETVDVDPFATASNLPESEEIRVTDPVSADDRLEAKLATAQDGSIIRLTAAAEGSYTVTYSLVAPDKDPAPVTINVRAVALEARVSPTAAEVNQGATVEFIDESTGLGTERSWDLGDGSPPLSDERVTRTFDTVGTYAVTLTVRDRTRAEQVETVNITVNEGPRTVTFVAKDVNLRSEPALSGEPKRLGDVTGQTRQVRPRPTNGWYQIVGGDDDGLWVFGALVLPQDGGLRVGETFDGQSAVLLDENGEPLMDGSEPATNQSGRLVLVEGNERDLYIVRLPEGGQARVAASTIRILFE
jgi:PKD repeat protein